MLPRNSRAPPQSQGQLHGFDVTGGEGERLSPHERHNACLMPMLGKLLTKGSKLRYQLLPKQRIEQAKILNKWQSSLLHLKQLDHLEMCAALNNN